MQRDKQVGWPSVERAGGNYQAAAAAVRSHYQTFVWSSGELRGRPHPVFSSPPRIGRPLPVLRMCNLMDHDRELGPPMTAVSENRTTLTPNAQRERLPESAMRTAPCRLGRLHLTFAKRLSLHHVRLPKL